MCWTFSCVVGIPVRYEYQVMGTILEFCLDFVDYLGVIGADMGSRPVFGSKR